MGATGESPVPPHKRGSISGVSRELESERGEKRAGEKTGVQCRDVQAAAGACRAGELGRRRVGVSSTRFCRWGGVCCLWRAVEGIPEGDAAAAGLGGTSPEGGESSAVPWCARSAPWTVMIYFGSTGFGVLQGAR